jgi:hypothetical protein
MKLMQDHMAAKDAKEKVKALTLNTNMVKLYYFEFFILVYLLVFI